MICRQSPVQKFDRDSKGFLWCSCMLCRMVPNFESVHERELFGGAFFRYCPQGVYYAGGVLTLICPKNPKCDH